MSEEQLKAFVSMVKADTSLQEKLKAEGADPVVIARDAGFVITEEEVNAYQANLSDDELERLAGGYCDPRYSGQMRTKPGHRSRLAAC